MGECNIRSVVLAVVEIDAPALGHTAADLIRAEPDHLLLETQYC